MKEQKYSEKDINLIKELLRKSPVKIYYDFDRYIFDCGEYYILLRCEIEEAATQNDSDEVIYSKIEKATGKIEISKEAKLVGDNIQIIKIYIAQTKIYFTNHRVFNPVERAVNNIKYKLQKLFKREEDKVSDLIASVQGGHREITCHPDCKLPKRVNSEFVNLVDTGLLLETPEKRYICAYIKGNGFGFFNVENKFFYEAKQLKEDIELFKFIEV